MSIPLTAAWSAVPGGGGESQQSIDGRTFVIGWIGRYATDVHQLVSLAEPISGEVTPADGITRATRTAQALNSAVPDLGSETSMVSRLVGTSSGKCSVMNTTPARSPSSILAGASILPRR